MELELDFSWFHGKSMTKMSSFAIDHLDLDEQLYTHVWHPKRGCKSVISFAPWQALLNLRDICRLLLDQQINELRGSQLLPFNYSLKRILI